MHRLQQLVGNSYTLNLQLKLVILIHIFPIKLCLTCKVFEFDWKIATFNQEFHYCQIIIIYFVAFFTESVLMTIKRCKARTFLSLFESKSYLLCIIDCAQSAFKRSTTCMKNIFFAYFVSLITGNVLVVESHSCKNVD